MVVPSHATPMTNMHADMPDLNTWVVKISAAGSLHTSVMIVAVANINEMMASFLGNVGCEINPTWSEIKVA